MVQINDSEIGLLADAVSVWTGWREATFPRRDESRFEQYYGHQQAQKLLQLVQRLEEDFYSSDARFVAADIQEMWRISIEQFKNKYPSLPDEIAQAFAWCYTYDFK